MCPIWLRSKPEIFAPIARSGRAFQRLDNRVLLSERSQFIHKLSTLEQIVDDVGDCFVEWRVPGWRSGRRPARWEHFGCLLTLT
jgi:hypothetical protein